jgi:hypothetical protein
VECIRIASCDLSCNANNIENRQVMTRFDSENSGVLVNAFNGQPRSDAMRTHGRRGWEARSPEGSEPLNVRKALRELATEDNYQNMNSDKDETVCCKKAKR